MGRPSEIRRALSVALKGRRGSLPLVGVFNDSENGYRPDAQLLPKRHLALGGDWHGSDSGGGELALRKAVSSEAQLARREQFGVGVLC